MKILLSKNNIKKLRPDLPFYLLGLLLLLGIKYFYSGAGSDELLWILSPTTGWVELLSGIPFVYENGTGYVNHSLRLLIAPSCSGVQFMLIAFATLLFSFLHRIGNACILKKGLWFIASLSLSWILTVFVNGLRIIAAIYLPYYVKDINFVQRLLPPDRLHTVIGIVVYFISLLTVFQLTEYAFRRHSESSRTGFGTASPWTLLLRKCVPPVFWYFLIVLGLPFLNRAYRKNGAGFTDFALLVAVCCGGILLCILLLYTLFSPLKKRLSARLTCLFRRKQD